MSAPHPRARASAVESPRIEAPVRGERWMRALESLFLRAEQAADRYLPEGLDPLLQTGAVANTTLIATIATGIALLLWYVPSVHGAYDSVTAMAGGLGGLVRSVHRYAADATMFFVLLHAARLFLARRFTGARVLAWVTGLAAIVVLWFDGWTGYWLVWDQRGAEIARGTAHVLDALPIFDDPPSRAFLTDENLDSLLFFVVFFIHMLVPLAMAIALWLHVARVARSKFLVNREMAALVVAVLVVASIAVPADIGAAARMTVPAGAMSIDAWYALPIALTERLGTGALWAVGLVASAVTVSLPWALVKGRNRVAVVDESKCTACERCWADCPYDAITMEARKDGRPYASVATVDPAKCVGCGICAGACDSAGIGLPWWSVVEERKRVDDLVEDAIAGGRGREPGQAGGASIAFVCAESAGGALKLDRVAGTCEELPGWRVVEVPCSGWLHPLTVERAFRHGADRALVVACGHGECRYREGADWTELRMAAERAPKLRHEKVAPERVLVARLDRNRVGDLTETARSFRGQGRSSRGAAVAVGGALAAVLTAAIVLVSRFGYAAPPVGPELVVSFAHPGQTSDVCRVLSDEEKAALPPHMRQDKVCERGRSPVRLRVTVDGAVALDKSFAPTGLWGDGTSVAVETLPLPPGDHDVGVALADGPGDAWPYTEERTVSFADGARHVVLFDRVSGFTWH